MKKLIISTIALCVLASCSEQIIKVNTKAIGDLPSTMPSSVKWSHFFIHGIGQTSHFNGAQVCQGGQVDFVGTRFGGWQLLASAITWNIYTPREVSVYCSSK